MTSPARRAGRHRTALTWALAGALMIGAPLTLSGCTQIEGFVEQQTGGDIDLGGASVPADFPSEVPLAVGTIVNGSAVAGSDGQKVWNVLINATDADAPTSIASQLEAAGFVSPGVGELTDNGGTLTYTKDDLVVNVLLAKVNNSWTANYTVARTAAAQ